MHGEFNDDSPKINTKKLKRTHSCPSLFSKPSSKKPLTLPNTQENPFSSLGKATFIDSEVTSEKLQNLPDDADTFITTAPLDDNLLLLIDHIFTKKLRAESNTQKANTSIKDCDNEQSNSDEEPNKTFGR